MFGVAVAVKRRKDDDSTPDSSDARRDNIDGTEDEVAVYGNVKGLLVDSQSESSSSDSSEVVYATFDQLDTRA